MNKKLFAVAVVALAIGTATTAFAAEPQFNDSQLDWMGNIKQCLLDAAVPLTGDRPGAYLTKTLRLRCLPQYGDVCTACTDALGATPGEDRIDW